MKTDRKTHFRLAAGLLLAAGPICAQPVCSPAAFLQTRTYPTQVIGAAAATGDFTGDGLVDVAVAESEIAVLPGNGDGTFGEPILSVPGNHTNRLVAADLNDDGILDLASGDSGVSVYLGNGDGTFSYWGSYVGGSNVTGFDLGDFNGDGVPDLAESFSFYQNGVAVYLGYGDGTFQAPVQYFDGTPVSLAVADFNEDGRSDVATPLDDGTVAIYLSLPDGTLLTPTFLPVGADMRGSIAGDLDSDGHADLVVSRPDALAVTYGNGNGTFQPAVAVPIIGQVDPGFILDANGDGKNDIVVSRTSGLGNLAVLFQDAPDAFRAPAGYQASEQGSPLVTGDFDGDGRPDFATPSYYPKSLSVFLWQDPGYVAAPVVNLPLDPGPIAAGDFDGDGVTEIAAKYGFGGLGVSGRDADGRYRVLGVTTLPFDPYVGAIAAADFSADERSDLVLASDALFVLLSNGDYTFSPAGTQPSITLASNVVAAADLDGNGTIDLATVAVDGATARLTTFRGNGDGSFQEAVLGPVTPHAVGSLIAVDLDGNGALDLVSANGGACCGRSSDTVSVFLGNGDGTFQSLNEYSTGPVPSSIASADFDGDGHPDVVTSNSGSTNVSILRGDGAGGLQPQILVAVAWSPVSVVAADFDGDEFADVATADGGNGNGSGRIVSLLRGTGGGAFDAPELYQTSADPVYLATGMFDGTGSTGVAVANASSYGGASIEFLLPARLTVSHVEGPASVVVSSALLLRISASGSTPASYQWRRDGAPLSDGGPVSGATAATLTIDPVAFSDAGAYDVVVTDACASVSAAPVGVAVEFADVFSSSPFHDDIIVIATSGVTGGCGGGNYCPAAPVRRDQMAAFLLKSKHGSAYAPPACSGVFSDVPCPGPFANWIEQFAAENVTSGCGAGIYCPNQSVTRAQMAVFLLKTKESSAYVPPPATGVFGDVPVGSFAADFIEDLHARGITGGCSASPLLYCPSSAVLRQQMATLLVRTFFP